MQPQRDLYLLPETNCGFHTCLIKKEKEKENSYWSYTLCSDSVLGIKGHFVHYTLLVINIVEVI